LEISLFPHLIGKRKKKAKVRDIIKSIKKVKNKDEC